MTTHEEDLLDILYHTSSSEEEEEDEELEDPEKYLESSDVLSPHEITTPSQPSLRNKNNNNIDRRNILSTRLTISNAAHVAYEAWYDVSKLYESIHVEIQEKRKKMKIKRDLAVKELVETERAYALRMKFVLKVLQPLLTKTQRIKLGLVELESLVPLSERIAAIDTNIPGELFRRFYANSIKMYRNYCVNQPVAASLVKSWIKKTPKIFQDYETRVFGPEKDLPPRIYGTNLLSALMQPVQRVMRYGMLLKAILKSETRGEEKLCLGESIAMIEFTCKQIDTQMQRPRLERLYASIEELRPGTLRPKRAPLLVHRCTLYEMQNIFMILFSDLVVLAKLSECETIVRRVLRYVPYSKFRVVTLHDNVSVRVVTNQERFTLSFDSDEDREKFVVACCDVVVDVEKISDIFKPESFEINTIQVPRYQADRSGTYWYELHVIPRGCVVREYERVRHIRGVILNNTTSRGSNGSFSSSTGWTSYVRFNQIKSFVHVIGTSSSTPRYEGKLITPFSSDASRVARERKNRIGDFLDSCASSTNVRNTVEFRELIQKRSCPYYDEEKEEEEKDGDGAKEEESGDSDSDEDVVRF